MDFNASDKDSELERAQMLFNKKIAIYIERHPDFVDELLERIEEDERIYDSLDARLASDHSSREVRGKAGKDYSQIEEKNLSGRTVQMGSKYAKNNTSAKASAKKAPGEINDENKENSNSKKSSSYSNLSNSDFLGENEDEKNPYAPDVDADNSARKEQGGRYSSRDKDYFQRRTDRDGSEYKNNHSKASSGSTSSGVNKGLFHLDEEKVGLIADELSCMIFKNNPSDKSPLEKTVRDAFSSAVRNYLSQYVSKD